MKHFVVINEYCCDGEYGINVIAVKHTIKEAMDAFIKALPDIKNDIRTNEFDCINEEETYIVGYKYESRCMNHIQLYIQEVEESK